MPTGVRLYTDWEAKARLAVIRKENVERHVGYEVRQKLRERIRRHQINQTHQLEYDRLKAATVQGNLHAAALKRLEYLKNALVSK